MEVNFSVFHVSSGGDGPKSPIDDVTKIVGGVAKKASGLFGEFTKFVDSLTNQSVDK